jgi:hypothetical protein
MCKSICILLVLVILAPALLWAQARPTTVPTTQPTTRLAGTRPVPPGELLDSLLKPPSAVGQPLQPINEGPAADATTGKAAVAPGAPQLNVLREGTYVVDRTGRLTRGSDGQTAEFTFDADGKALKDPPMVILPNRTLMQMENAIQSTSKDLKFRVTGMVTEYKGRNYVLLEKVVVVPEVIQQF